MGFISMIFTAILAIISMFGIVSIIIGVVFLIVYLARRKIKKKKGFLIAAIVFLIIGIPTAFTFPGFTTIANNAAINDSVNPKEYPIVNAIAKHDNSKLKKLLENGKNPNEVYDGFPAIFWTCDFDYGANSEATKLLISYHANINARASNQESLMKWILVGNHRYGDDLEIYNIVKLLIDNGYDADETDSNGVTLLMYANMCSGYEFKYSLSCNITQLLTKSGAKINTTDNDGRTVLMWACGSSKSSTDIERDSSRVPKIKGKTQFAQFDYNTIKYLVKNGVDINYKDKQGHTALDYFKQQEENSKSWYQYSTVGKTKEYIDTCKFIEVLLQGK